MLSSAWFLFSLNEWSQNDGLLLERESFKLPKSTVDCEEVYGYENDHSTPLTS